MILAGALAHRSLGVIMQHTGLQRSVEAQKFDGPEMGGMV